MPNYANTVKHPISILTLFLLLSGWFYILYEYAVRVSDSVIITPLMQSLNINATQIGVLSSAYNITYILMQIPAGIIMDKFGILKTWIIAVLCVAVGCYLFSISNTLNLAIAGRALMGFGSAFAWVGIVSLVCSLFNVRNHAFYIGISMTMCMLGAVLGQAPWLILTHWLGSWQQPYLWAAGFGIFLAALLRIISSKNRLVSQRSTPQNLTSLFRSLKSITVSKTFLILAFYITAISLPQNAFSALWAVEFFKHDYQFSPHLAAAVVSAVWFGGIVGAPLLGFLARHIHNQKTFLLIGNLITLLLTFIMIFVKIKSTIFVVTILFSIGLITNISVIIYAQAATLGGATASATSVAAINMLNMGGAALVQILMGYIPNGNQDAKLKLSKV